jgi:hypothetical protein
VISPWITEIQARRVAAQAENRSAIGRLRMTRDEIAPIVTAVGDLVQIIRDADPADKADLYAQLGPDPDLPAPEATSGGHGQTEPPHVPRVCVRGI